MGQYLRYLVQIGGILFVGASFLVFSVYVEPILLFQQIEPVKGTMLPSWLQRFKELSAVVGSISLLFSLTWYVICQWKLRIIDYRSSGRRLLWCLLGLFPAVAAIAAIIFTEHPEDGGWIAYSFYMLNALGSYYFSTALFSPSSFKYSPFLSTKLRWLP